MKPVFCSVLILSFFLWSCSSAVRYSSDARHSEAPKVSGVNTANVKNKVFRGLASYYGDKFNGNPTASGEIFDQSDYTAAHISLPFGTKIKVTNLDNNRSVVVRINDRGPFVTGRILDLSKAAAEKLDMIRSGVVSVEVEVLDD